MISSGAPVASVVRRLATVRKRSSWVEKNTMQTNIVMTIPNWESQASGSRRLRGDPAGGAADRSAAPPLEAPGSWAVSVMYPSWAGAASCGADHDSEGDELEGVDPQLGRLVNSVHHLDWKNDT